jgi:hypothetical protein
MWCGDGHLHRKCPENNEHSTPCCCNFMFAVGEKPHPSTYHGCSHAKELFCKKVQRASKAKTPTGRAFFSRYTTPAFFFTAAFCRDPQS